MFQQPKTYPEMPLTITNFLRNVNGVVLPRFIKKDQVEILHDIQVVQIENQLIPHYSCIQAPWVDAVYDAWIKVGKVDNHPDLVTIAIQNIKNPVWWHIT